MTNVAVRIGLLLSAFSPLLVALALLRVAQAGTWWNWIALIASAMPALLLGIFLVIVRRVLPKHEIVTTRVRRNDEAILAFVSSYLLPIATSILAPADSGWVPTGILLVLLALVYLRGDLVHLNPLLVIAGYRLYVVEYAGGVEANVLLKESYLSQASTISNLLELNRGTFIQGAKK